MLTGSRDKRILENNHDKLSTYGLLSDNSRHTVHDWIEQLTGQGCIEKTGEYNVLTVTPKGWTVLKGLHSPRLLKPAERPAKVSRVIADSWDGVDRRLFESLRRVRAQIAGQSKVPAFVIFSDAALRDMARRKPTTREAFLNVKGVGEKKCKQYGSTILAAIQEYCRADARE